MESSKTSIAALSQLLDQEDKRSRKQQLQSFFNHLFLGQWEFARASSSLVCRSSRGDERELVLRTLLDVASNPYEQRFGASVFASLEQLCWLALQEYEQQKNSEPLDTDAAALKQDVEFRLILAQECRDAEPSILSSVYQYYQKHHGSAGHAYTRLATLQAQESLPKDVADFLKKTLLEKPATGHHLICALMPSTRTTDNRECEALQGLYLRCINSLLDSLGPAGEQRTASCEKILQLLSFFDPEPYWNYLQIRQLFSHLVTLSKTEHSGFTVDRVMESLMGRSRGYLLEEFEKLLHEVDVSGACREGDALSEEQKLTLHLLTGGNRDSCWQSFFVSCLRWNKHFLGLIMDTCISLVLAERFETLGAFLDPPELRPLKPVVLLACWTYCRSSTSARRLLDTLWTPTSSTAHPALTAGCNRLAYQLSLIKWCLERARPLLENSDLPTSPSTHDDRATRLLHGLETHSVLFVLHRSTRLAALDSQEVLQLLQNVARDPEEKKAKKTVRFQDEKQQQDTSEPISAEQEHDICIYRSYCAIKNIMEAILFCYENSNLDLMNPISMKAVLKPRHLSKAFSCDTLSSSEGDESSSPSGGRSEEGVAPKLSATNLAAGMSFQEVYRRRVWQRIQQAREHLQHLYPLTYRVEVLENIFSLLFCRHSDIMDGALSVEGDSDDEAEGYDSKKGSSENLNMSTVSEEDLETERFTGSAQDQVSLTSSLNLPQSDSAVRSSLGHDEQEQNSGRVDYDEPFEEKKNAGAYQRHFKGKTRFTDLVSRSLSQGLSQADYSCGFLANEYVVRDVLAMLKEALVDLSAVRFKLQGQSQAKSETGAKHVLQGQFSMERMTGSPTRDLGSPHFLQRQGSVGSKGVEPNRARASPERHHISSRLGEDVDFNPELEKVLARTVSASISPDVLQKRIAQLTQHVHEAQWRFQLVAHEQLPKQAGRVLEEMVVVADDDGQLMCVKDDWMSSWRTQVSKSGDGNRTGRSCTKPSLKSSQTASSVGSHSRLAQPSVVTRMLSSPETLLTMSLMKNNFAQAAQVIKLMKLNEKTREVAEVSFSESFDKTAQAVSALNVAAKERRTSSSSKKFSMAALKSAAAAGVATASLSNFVEELLASPHIPALPKPRSESSQVQDAVLMQLFHVDTALAILLDLACTSCNSWELCCNVFDIIRAKGKTGKEKQGKDSDGTALSSKGPTEKKSRSSSLGSGLKGCKGLFNQLDKLLQLGHADPEQWAATNWFESSNSAPGSAAGTPAGVTSPVIILPTSHVPPSSRHSLVQHFRRVAPPMTASGLKQYEGVVREIQQAFEHANQALLASSRLDRQESINIEEQHFAKSPTTSSPASISPSMSRSSSLNSTSSLSKEATPGKSEVPVLHTKMKQLIAAMEKFVPHGGLYLLLTGSSGRGDRCFMRNYLLSMYEHVKELAFVVAECESKARETLVLPKNYFSILQEGPVDILGRLMFIKRILPGKLEKMAKKLSLNLTHIIVQSCCPQIPSKHLPHSPAHCSQGVEKAGARCIYNSGSCVDQEAASTSDPELLVRTILSDIIAAMQETAVRFNGKGVFTETCGREFVKSEHFSKMISSVRELQHADLTLLDSREKRLCFFANLLNLMTIHYHLHNIRQLSEVEKLQSDSTRGDPSSWRLSGLQGDHLIDMVTQLGAFCYRVGQLGVLSLFDLKYVMLHHGQNLSGIWKSLLTSGSHKLAPEDPMSAYMPPAEPRLMFVVSDGCQSSPPITVLKPGTLSFQLETATQNYLLQAVKVDTEARKVMLPFLLTSLSLDPPAGKQSQCQTPYDNLLNFISINTASTQTEQLEQLIGTDGEDKGVKTSASFEVCLSPFVSDFAYIFTMQDLVTDLPPSERDAPPQSPKQIPGMPHLGALGPSVVGPAISGSVSWPQHLFMESSGNGLEQKMSLAEPASYQLTPVTLDYVRETSTLVATLLTLTCSDELDDIEAQFTDDHFQASSFPRNRTSSDISVVDIRSYRYHRLVDDFPILLRHLLAYIIPLAGADNPEISHSGEPILKFVTNNINEDVKLCLFSLHDSLQFLDMLQKMVSRLGRRRHWAALIPAIRSIPEVVMTKYPHLQLLHDFVLNCWARETSTLATKTRSFASSLSGALTVAGSRADATLHQLRKFYCADTQARVVLAVCDAFPVDYGLDLLKLCLTQSLDPGLRSAVEAKHHFLGVYSRISSSIKTLQIRLAMQASEATIPGSAGTPHSSSKEYQKLLTHYSDWRYTAKMSREDPREVLSVLIKTGDFAVARDWARLYELPRDMVLEMEVWYILSLLSPHSSGMLPAYQALEDLRNARQVDCLQVCQTLLERLDDQRKVKFLTSYMLRHLTATLTSEELENLRLKRIGAKALLCIPQSMRSEYVHLLSSPHLILEQLLMNMKGELAGCVFADIRDDFGEIKDSKLKVAQEQFDALLTNYARRALEVTVVQAVDSRPSTVERSRAMSTGSGGSSRAEDEGRTTPIHRVATESVLVRMRNVDAMTPKLGTTPPGGSHSVPRRSSLLTVQQSAIITTRTASSKFIMPVVPPTEDQWVPDSSTSLCMVCKLERFSMFNRRHHCRRCGRVVCAACSTKRSQVRDVSARTCDECYEQIFGPRESRAKDEQEVYSQRMKESLSGASPNPSSSGFSSTPSPFSTSEFGRPRTLSSAIHHDVHEWKLKPDEGYNSYVRDEFYYEQAPSVTLCMSILQHHSDSHTSGQLILTMCDDLSSFLQPVAPGVPNLEVDFSLIISIIRELLFRAKVIFLKSGDSSMIGQCDGYQTRVDLLKILLEANYPDLPTLQELTKMDTARRLRDKLVRDERLPLALEVCTKCGVDSAVVWVAWGRACLHIGDFAGARDKFAHILKAPSDKNQTGGSSRLLMEIIEQLEALPPTGATEIQMLLSEPASLKTLISSPMPGLQEETSVESAVYQECVYYLRTYGTYSEHLKFLLRNGYWNKALRFFIDKRCSTDVFVESLLLPALKAGDLTRLTEQLLMQDSSLELWMPHLTASCRHLLKQRRFHILYNMQLFMKDFLRAAMTCITHFYQQGAQSYLDLAGRLQFLFIAQEHMQAYLDPQRWGAIRHPLVSPVTPTSPQVGSPRRQDGGGGAGGSHASAQLCMSREDVAKHLHTIALQIEVTQFLEQCLSNNMGEAAAMATQYVVEAHSQSIVPTLFGNQEQRKDLVKMILLSGGKLQTAFDLALRIFYECKLKPVAVLKKAVSEQLKMKRSKDMLQLLDMVDQRRILDDDEWDEVVSSALLELTEKQMEARDETEALIKMIRKEHNKINALIMSGKLRSAYLTAAKTNRAHDITRIMAAAERMGQAAVRNICKKWLEQQQKRDADNGHT